MGLHALVDAASEIVEAASALHHTWDHSQLLTDPSGSKAFGSFTCAEADALARLLCALSMHETAEGVIRQHARADEDETDSHHSTYLLVEASDVLAGAPIVGLGGNVKGVQVDVPADRGGGRWLVTLDDREDTDPGRYVMSYCATPDADDHDHTDDMTFAGLNVNALNPTIAVNTP